MDINLITEPERIYCESDGKLLAEVTFPLMNAEVANINHTFVDESLRGQGVAGKLMQAVCETIRERGLKAYPTCSYAIKWLSENEEFYDIYHDVMDEI